MDASASTRSRVASYISICVRSRRAARKFALSVRSSRMRDRRARASGWSTTVSCTRCTVAARAGSPIRAPEQGAERDGSTAARCPSDEERFLEPGFVEEFLDPGFDQDFGAVGAVGVPSAVGVAFDPEAVVDLGVVPLAQQAGV